MANRRMFSLDVVDTDKFLEMPTSTQALYFQLGMRADDDGFVSSPKRITSLIGASPDDLKLLIAKGFVIAFDNEVIKLNALIAEGVEEINEQFGLGEFA